MRPLSKAEAESLYEKLAQHRPSPRTELCYHNTFTLLVAVLLSAQATDKSVNAATPALFAQADSPEKMLSLGEKNIAQYIRSIGLWRTKAKNIAALSAQLLEQHQGQVPACREALMGLPGIGRKTANVVLNEAFGHPTIAVDTHIFRVSNRTGLAAGKTPDAVEKKLLQITPKPYRKNAHHWLILHGRYLCTARKPRCGQCPILQICRYQDKTA